MTGPRADLVPARLHWLIDDRVGEAANIDGLGRLIVAKVQAVGGLTRTLTCPVVHL